MPVFVRVAQDLCRDAGKAECYKRKRTSGHRYTTPKHYRDSRVRAAAFRSRPPTWKGAAEMMHGVALFLGAVRWFTRQGSSQLR